MVSYEGKLQTFKTFFVLVWLPAIAVYLLSSTGSFSNYITTTFFVLLTIACLAVSFITKSDDKYYRNLNPFYLVLSIIAGLGMTAFSWGLSMSLKNPNMLLSVNSLSLVPANPNSILALVFSLLVFGLVMAATGEEVFKLVIFSELKERCYNGLRIGRVTVPGVLVYVGFPVGFWAILHGITAYDNPIAIVPAFINGLVLMIYLWQTRSILGCILAHWLYNSVITVLTFANGSANIPAGTPLFPDLFASGYFGSPFFIDLSLFMVVTLGVIYFLLPSLKPSR